MTKKGYIMKNKKINFVSAKDGNCDSLLAETNEKMTKLIDDFNEKCEKENRNVDCDTVDLDSKFDELSDYVEDYTNEYEEVEEEQQVQIQ